MEIDANRLLMGLMGAALIGIAGSLWETPTRLALIEERAATLGGQLDETLDLVSALHPRSSGLAGGPPEATTEAEARAARIRALKSRAPAPTPVSADDDDSAEALACPPCPPCAEVVP